MKGYKISVLISAALLSGLYGCSSKSLSSTDVDYADFAHTAADYIITGDQYSKEKLETEITSHRKAYEAVIKVMGVDESEWLSSPSVYAFAADIDTISPPAEKMEQMLSHMIDKAEKDGLELPVKCFASVIWGKPQSIIFCDSCMLIAQNHYLGSNHPAYGSLDTYRRQSKSLKAMPYDIAEAMVATRYPFTQTDDTKLINRLIYEGVITEAKMRMVENASLADALGYTREQMDVLIGKESEIWDKMVGSKMLFDTSATQADRFISPAPFTSPLSADLPGRAGRYIGYKLVRAYLDANPEMKLSDMLSPDFYNAANPLVNIAYSGGKKH